MATRAKLSEPPALGAEDEQFLDDLGRICAKGVQQAREENRRLGIPNVEVRDGQIVEVMPDDSVRVVGPVWPAKP